MKAIETTATIDNARHLSLDRALPVSARSKVKVIVLYDEDSLSEALWLEAASTNPAFEDLHDAKEDIYSLSDGKPFHG